MHFKQQLDQSFYRVKIITAAEIILNLGIYHMGNPGRSIFCQPTVNYYVMALKILVYQSYCRLYSPMNILYKTKSGIFHVWFQEKIQSNNQFLANKDSDQSLLCQKNARLGTSK